eukprot:1156318-Pelagomonas_calceolata.AAC.15
MVTMGGDGSRDEKNLTRQWLQWGVTDHAMKTKSKAKSIRHKEFSGMLKEYVFAKTKNPTPDPGGRVSHETLNVHGDQVAYKIRFASTMTACTCEHKVSERSSLPKHVGDWFLRSYKAASVKADFFTSGFAWACTVVLVSVPEDVLGIVLAKQRFNQSCVSERAHQILPSCLSGAAM